MNGCQTFSGSSAAEKEMSDTKRCHCLAQEHTAGSFLKVFSSTLQGSESPMMLGDSKSDLEDVDP